MFLRFYFLVLLGLCINLKCTDDSGATRARRVLDLDVEQQTKICASLRESIARKDFGRLQVIARLGVTAPKELQANINALLLLAAHNGNFKDVKTMVELGADITVIDEYGNTPIMKAIRPRREEVSKAFEDRFKAAEYLLSFYGQHLDHKNHAEQTIHTLIDATMEKWARKKSPVRRCCMKNIML
jgi:ankyrin repeat protein